LKPIPQPQRARRKLTATHHVKPLVLLVTNKFDVTTDFVVAALRRLGAPFIRLNTEDLFTKWNVTWTNEDAVLQRDAEIFRLRDVRSVYYRRPKTPNPGDGISPDAVPFAVKETRALLQNLLSNIDAHWISSVQATERAENKLLQLQVARHLGFRTPDTLITNQAATAEAFVAEHGATVVKPLSNGWLTDDPPRIAFTTSITPEMMAGLAEAIACSPHLLQERIDKKFDIRVTVVENSVFACRIYSQDHEETRTDFRVANTLDFRLEHELKALPKAIDDLCTRLVKAFALNFGAIDLVEGIDGYTFLEINPNGQWAWIEQLTGAPISAAIATSLARTLL
jgi:glutathione synthase/RimK-type ligase-like ATP-grasp enzyme